MNRSYLKRLGAIVLALGILLSAVGVQVFAADSIEPGKYDDATREDVAHITGLKLSVDPDDATNVWGYGIVTGTGPFDADDERGNDSANNNTRVRSYDTVTYNVEAVVQSNDPLATYPNGRVGYQFILPNDPELELDIDSMDWAKQDMHLDVVDDQKIYTVYRNLPTTNGAAIPGGCTVPFVLKVGGKYEGEKIQPTVIAWAEGNANTLELKPAEVVVTSIPKYNVQLVRYGTMSANNAYDFTGNAYNPDAGKVTGYETVYGFVLQLKNDNADKGIRGIEMPSGPITFDVDLTSTFRTGANSETDITNDYPALLYKIANNGEKNQIVEMPMTKGDNDYSCKDSGTCTAVQNGNKITFTISDYVIDMDTFPKTSQNGKINYYLEGGKVNVGCFSAFKITLIQPIKLADGSDLRVTHADTGTVQVDIEDTNLNVNSQTGIAVATQTVTTDDALTYTRAINAGGSRDHEIFYSTPGNQGTGTDGKNNGNKGDGSDSAVCGSTVGYTVVYNERDIGSEDINEHTVAFNQLVKFDDCALEVDTESLKLTSHVGDWNRTIKFAAKPDGTGWAHNDLKPDEAGYDTEMLYAVEEDLVYYDTYEALLADGKVCVGILHQNRGCRTVEGNLQLMLQTVLKVKTDASIGNYVYMLHASTNVWLGKDVEEAAAAYLEKNADELTLADYQKYAKEQFDADHATTPFAHSIDIDKTDYVKAVYDESGYKGGDSSGFSKGDSLYIIPYEASVSLLVAQKEVGGAEKTSYDLDAGYRYVDFVIASGLHFKQEVIVPGEKTTTVTITTTLAEGLNYIEGSSYQGGEYLEQSPDAGLVANGTNIEPTVSTNTDGETVLTWTIPDMPIENGDMPLIHFSCELGDKVYPDNDVENQQSLVAEATISTTEDIRPHTVYNNNVSTTSVTVVKLASFNITKTGEHALETSGTGHFELIVNNSSNTHKSNLCAIDTMPQDGVNGSVISTDSRYAITSMTLNVQAIKDISDVRIYYTNDKAYAGKTSADIDVATIEANWQQATLAEDGTITGEGLIGSWPVAFAYVDDKLNAHCSASITFEYTAQGSAGDKLYNSFSQEDLRKISEVLIYGRSISGTAWFDNDEDDIRGDADDLLSGITVTLLDENGVAVATTVTDANGTYQFDNVPGGEYSIEFSSDTVDLSRWEVVDKNAADAGEDNASKAEGVYTDGDSTTKALTKAVITGVSLPSLVDLQAGDTQEYVMLYQDAGFMTAPVVTTTSTTTTTTTTTTTESTTSTTASTESTTTTTESTTITTESTATSTETTGATASTTTTESTTTTSSVETTTTEEVTTTQAEEDTIPQTGENTLCMVFVLLAALSLVAVSGMMLYRQKQS